MEERGPQLPREAMQRRGPQSGLAVVFCALGKVEDTLPRRTRNAPIPYLLTPSLWPQGEKGGGRGRNGKQNDRERVVGT